MSLETRVPARAYLKPVATFCYVWLMVGFFTGTLVLLGPVRWLTVAVRNAGWQQSNEDLAVRSVIAIYVVASACAAWRNLPLTHIACSTKLGAFRAR